MLHHVFRLLVMDRVGLGWFQLCSQFSVREKCELKLLNVSYFDRCSVTHYTYYYAKI